LRLSAPARGTREGRLVGMISTHWREAHTPGEDELLGDFSRGNDSKTERIEETIVRIPVAVGTTREPAPVVPRAATYNGILLSEIITSRRATKIGLKPGARPFPYVTTGFPDAKGRNTVWV